MRQTRQRRRCGALTEHHTGFLIWEFPTVYISQKLRVAKYLGEDRYPCIYPVLTWSWTIVGANIVLWGVVLMLHAAGTSFGAIFALRILLGTATSIRYHEAPALTMTGMLESCVAPILILIISMFYKKNEQATRISWFYVMVRAPVLCIHVCLTNSHPERPDPDFWRICGICESLANYCGAHAQSSVRASPSTKDTSSRRTKLFTSY